MGKRTVDFCLQCQKFIELGEAETHLTENSTHHLVETYVDEDYYNTLISGSPEPSELSFRTGEGEEQEVVVVTASGSDISIRKKGDDSRVPINKPSTNISFSNKSAAGLYQKTSSYGIKAVFEMRGTKHIGKPKEIKFLVSSASSSFNSNAGIRLFDVLNNKTICEISDIGYQSKYSFINVTDFDYLPEEDTVVEIQLLGHKNKNFYCYTLSVYY